MSKLSLASFKSSNASSTVILPLAPSGRDTLPIISAKFFSTGFNLLDNLDRSRISIENDDTLKNSDSLKKILEHLDIIKNDMISIRNTY